MKIEYCFDHRIRVVTDEAEFYMLDGVKGISFPGLQEAYVNLSCDHWKRLKEKTIIEETTKTVVHETVHLLIGTKTTPKDYTLLGEEKVCLLMAAQEVPEDLADPKVESFI